MAGNYCALYGVMCTLSCKLKPSVGNHQVAVGEYVVRVEILLNCSEQSEAGRRHRSLQELLPDLTHAVVM
jgi:hypothetical protein